MSLKDLLTASRRGSAQLRTRYIGNDIYFAISLGICAVLWVATREWLFPEFSPMSYWNIAEGGILENVAYLFLPLFLYIVGMIPVIWLGVSHSREDLGSENIIFKSFVSLTAGILEELSFRGFFIWLGLILTFFSNFVFKYMIAIVIVIILLDTLTKNLFIGILLLGIAIPTWMYVNSFKNPVHSLNGFILTIDQWFIADKMRMLAIVFSIALIVFLAERQKAKESLFSRVLYGKHYSLQLAISLTMLAFWVMYSFTKGIETLSDLPIIPEGADKWTALLYLGAVMWTNTKFSKGHSYQGLIGRINSYGAALYMVYIAFNFGLIYAIIVHFLYDFILFASEHIIHIIKVKKGICEPPKSRRFVNEELQGFFQQD